MSHPEILFQIQACAFGTAFIGCADALRFRSPAFERTYERVLGVFMREEERDTVNGVVSPPVLYS
jgi:hypothetical protein